MKAKSLNIIATAALALASWSCTQTDGSINYAQQIADNEMMDSVDAMARQIIRQGFNAGDGYSEVWIRDYSTFIELSSDKEKKKMWADKRDQLKQNIRQHLWDEKNRKFIPHIYLDKSPFPADFDENKIYYHGGTAVAILAGILTGEEVAEANKRMLENMAKAHAQTIGLTMYPTYPAGYFQNVGMYPYGYQNGGDWTWFGARMIHALVKYGMIAEAYDELQPMLQRVVENKGFYEWYTPAGEPMGSGTFRGEAGVLFKANALLRNWAEQNK